VRVFVWCQWLCQFRPQGAQPQQFRRRIRRDATEDRAAGTASAFVTSVLRWGDARLLGRLVVVATCCVTHHTRHVGSRHGTHTSTFTHATAHHRAEIAHALTHALSATNTLVRVTFPATRLGMYAALRDLRDTPGYVPACPVPPHLPCPASPLHST